MVRGFDSCGRLIMSAGKIVELTDHILSKVNEAQEQFKNYHDSNNSMECEEN